MAANTRIATASATTAIDQAERRLNGMPVSLAGCCWWADAGTGGPPASG
jgi:hypothetical protein